MDNFKITKTILENINEQNDRINECVDIVNGYTTDEETRVNQELQRQQNELIRQEQYNNNENRFNEIKTQLDNKANKEKSATWINAKEMFKMVGDGITDESDKINEALSYIHSLGGGTLYFPKGIYVYSKALWFGVNTIIRGDGISNTIFKMKDNIDLDKASIGLTSEGEKIIVAGFIGMRNVEIKFSAFYDLEIDGNCSNNRHWNDTTPDKWTNYGTNINCISYDSVPDHNGKPIPPKFAIVENCYIHDAVRNCLLAKMAGTLNVNNCIFENSDVDHCLYVQSQQGYNANINNVTINDSPLKLVGLFTKSQNVIFEILAPLT